MSDDEDFPLRRSTRPRRSTVKALSTSEDESSGDTDPHHSVHVVDTVSTNADLAGKEIYSFNRVKKHERLLSTPQKHQKPGVLVPKTPHHVRKQLEKGIKSTIKDLSSDEDPFDTSESDYLPSNSSSSFDNSTSEEEQEHFDSDECQKPCGYQTRRSINPQMKMTNVKPNTKSSIQNKYVIKADEYFSHSNNKVTTSNHTLDKLKTPRLSQDQLQKLLSDMKLSGAHQKSIISSAQNSKNHFSKWLYLLHENFNILLYGLGSKKNLLNDFHTCMLSESPVIVINGFFPSLTLKDILDAIANDLLELDANTANVYDTVDAIAREMQFATSHIYLIVHNIEGEMLRNNKSQAVLSRLGTIPKVHIMASIDHINAPLIWDHNKLSKFNFVWYDVTSFLPYTDETSFESSMMVQRTGNLALSSLRNVFLSLTSNSKGIYAIIMKYQLEHNTNQYYQGLLFKDLYTACREAFLVSSDLALRAQLTEFVDHKMVKLRRSADGAEYLIISIANNLLQQFMKEQGK